MAETKDKSTLYVVMESTLAGHTLNNLFEADWANLILATVLLCIIVTIGIVINKLGISAWFIIMIIMMVTAVLIAILISWLKALRSWYNGCAAAILKEKTNEG